MRLCADFSLELNAALDGYCCPLPIPEDIFTNVNGGICLAKLDQAEAYFQIKVSPGSRNLLTLNAHRGLYQFTRLPFGVKPAPAIFQPTADVMLVGLQGVSAYLDGINGWNLGR